MYNIITTRQFEKDISLIVKRKYNIEAIKQVIAELEIKVSPHKNTNHIN
jgi:mRNA-degrading endonuclease YafQ of YafQ-DinJ toxin-antitoxin module